MRRAEAELRQRARIRDADSRRVGEDLKAVRFKIASVAQADGDAIEIAVIAGAALHRQPKIGTLSDALALFSRKGGQGLPLTIELGLLLEALRRDQLASSRRALDWGGWGGAAEGAGAAV